MRKALLLAILVVVPLAFVPWAVSFDTAKAFLLSLGALALLAIALQRPGGGTGPARLDLRWSGVSAAAAACWIALAAASFRGPDPWAAAAVLATLLAALVVLAAFENVMVDPEEVLPFASAVSVVLGIAAAYGLLQSVGVDFALRWRDDGRRDPISTFGNANWAAEFAAAAIPFAALAAHRCRGGARAGAILSILLAAGLLIVAHGRAGLLGAACAAAAGAAALLLGSPGRAARAGGLALAIGAVAAVAGGVAWLHHRDGLLSESLGRSDTAAVRVDLARGTARMLADHPLGVGPGGWAAAHPPYRTEREYRLSLFRDPGEAHCDPLESAAEGGWPAAVAILVLAALLMRAGGAAAARSGDRGTAAALCASLAAAAGASLFSAPFRRPASLLLAAAAAGMLAALAGGRTVPLAARGMWVVRAVTLLVVLGTGWLGVRAAAEGPHAEAREILREASPLPADRARAAREAFEDAVSLDPGSVEALSRAGEIAMKTAPGATADDAQADHRAALAAFESYARLRPLEPRALAFLATARWRLGDSAAAEAGWKQALAIQPWHRNALQGYAAFLVETGRSEEALPLLDRALAVDPVYPAALGTRVQALAVLGRLPEASAAGSDGVDRLLASPPRDLEGASEVARRTAAGHEELAEMLCVKSMRLLGGVDPDGGLRVALGIAEGRPSPSRLERLGRALGGAERGPESIRFLLGGRFLAAEEALAAGDREAAAAAALRATEVKAPPELARRVRVQAAGVLVRAGKREAALAEIGWAVSRGWGEAELLETDPAFAPIRQDPAFRGLVERARKAARRAER